VISLRSSPLLFLISLCAVAGLCVTAYKAALYIKTNHLAALPKANSDKLINIEAADGINKKVMSDGDSDGRVMLTYQTIYETWATASKAGGAIKLNAVNYTFPFVMGYAITDGSFFSQGAQDTGQAVAALNKKAAFNLFGSIYATGGKVTINGKAYTVAGVIDDNDDKTLNVYVPAAVLNEAAAQGVIVSLNGTSEEWAKNKLKAAYIDDARFHFINLGLVAQVVADKVYLSGIIAAMGFLIIAFKMSLRLLRVCLRNFKALRKEEYLMGILRGSPGTVFKLTASVILSVAIVVCLFALLPFVTEKFLVIGTVKGVFGGLVFSCFTAEITGLQSLYQLSNIFFTVFVMAFFGFTAAVTAKREQ